MTLGYFDGSKCSIKMKYEILVTYNFLVNTHLLNRLYNFGNQPGNRSNIHKIFYQNRSSRLGMHKGQTDKHSFVYKLFKYTLNIISIVEHENKSI